MEKQEYRPSDNLQNVMDSCIGDLIAYLGTLVALDPEPKSAAIVYTALALVEQAKDRMKHLCDFIEQELGEIHFVRDLSATHPANKRLIELRFRPSKENVPSIRTC